MLKYGLLCFIIMSVSPITTAFAADTQDVSPTIVWEKTFDDAAKKAVSAEIPILLDFYFPT